ncbi:hypothetical protein COLO4_32104 [Corchorus olitorius]|uniref:Uncharacterized protein n=1 Tax=Corchorus olitorius TaxID=93759 RepID=A0A1R3H1C2_9ROSI|nr:hypothetical protein COLO4_32104 [Corchorus olitorius]
MIVAMLLVRGRGRGYGAGGYYAYGESDVPHAQGRDSAIPFIHGFLERTINGTKVTQLLQALQAYGLEKETGV